jgi:hypothetical protein
MQVEVDGEMRPMLLLEALRAAPCAIQQRGEKVYEVSYRSAGVAGALHYVVKRYQTTQRTGPVIRALAEREALARFLHCQLALDPGAWEAAEPRLQRSDAPSLQSLLQIGTEWQTTY